ncbi:MAG: LLM class flavin-dependent oxidoreductase [Xanthobacteraceae bacterium]|nr:LLM class flavin-dependent oxidoreductase [Xanthobacteraceae bacterium]MBV9632610.1 LLM class flavin-dependent oxidoreductase [Xanthobacteraceae bacterium]
MSIDFFWRLPTQGDGHHPPGDNRRRGDWNDDPAHSTGALSNTRIGDPLTYIDYLAQVAQAAEINAFQGVLMVGGPACDEPWVVSSALAQRTRLLKYIVAFQPFHVPPSYAALMAATFQRLSGGRLMWNIINGSNDGLQNGYGDWESPDARYERTAEYIEIVRGLWSGEPFSFAGKYYNIRNGGLRGPHLQAPVPPICTVGSSDGGKLVAARHADIYLLRAETPALTGAAIAEMRALAAREGRSLRFGMSVDTLARRTEEEARAEAQRIYNEGVARGAANAAKALARASTSVGQSRQVRLQAEGDEGFERLFNHANVWSGYGYIGIPPGTALVGSFENVADRILEFHDAGVDMFILSGYPHLEEAYRIGENVLPLVRERLASRAAFVDAAE